jgi:chaperone modulatory protein CbpM
MKNLELIPLTSLCKHFEIEMSFFTDLQKHGLIQMLIIEKEYFIEEDSIDEIEKIIRLNKDLEINLQGIDAIFNLLTRIKSLENENQNLKNRLRLFDEF